MSNPNNIPNADLIRAALDGKVVQFKLEGDQEWTDFATARAAALTLLDSGWTTMRFRLKPEPVVKWATLWKTGTFNLLGAVDREDAVRQAWRLGVRGMPHEFSKVLRLELDPDTLEVISARTEAP